MYCDKIEMGAPNPKRSLLKKQALTLRSISLFLVVELKLRQLHTLPARRLYVCHHIFYYYIVCVRVCRAQLSQFIFMSVIGALHTVRLFFHYTQHRKCFNATHLEKCELDTTVGRNSYQGQLVEAGQQQLHVW